MRSNMLILIKNVIIVLMIAYHVQMDLVVINVKMGITKTNPMCA